MKQLRANSTRRATDGVWFLAVLCLVSLGSARAEEKPNQLLTALSSTTISGHIDAYVGRVTLPHRSIVLGLGVVSNRVVTCVLANENYETVASGTVAGRANGEVRGKVPRGYFRGRMTADGQAFEGRLVFIQAEQLRVRKFTLTLIP